MTKINRILCFRTLYLVAPYLCFAIIPYQSKSAENLFTLHCNQDVVNMSFDMSNWLMNAAKLRDAIIFATQLDQLKPQNSIQQSIEIEIGTLRLLIHPSTCRLNVLRLALCNKILSFPADCCNFFSPRNESNFFFQHKNRIFC